MQRNRGGPKAATAMAPPNAGFHVKGGRGPTKRSIFVFAIYSYGTKKWYFKPTELL